MDRARRPAAAQAEQAARDSYGRLVAVLAARTHDIAAAEDALAEAFAAALVQWPRDGVPDNPEGWLIAVSRRKLLREQDRTGRSAAAADLLALLHDERVSAAVPDWPDERLAMLFVCTHPAIAADVQAPLMMQAVLGLDAARIAAAFLVSPATMGQRLVRAKRKIRDAGIAFRVPELTEVGSRTTGVLSAIYAAYGTAWDDLTGADARLAGLREEALWLARLLVERLPDEPEALGLLALLLHCEARHEARRDANGGFVPLVRQDPARWSRAHLAEAEAALRRAAALARPGRFQTEAAIQSLHVHQRLAGERFAAALVRLYDVLAGFAPTAGVLVARAVALAEAGETAAAFRQMLAIAGAEDYQPWHAGLARIAWLAGDAERAAAAAGRAAALSQDPAIRRFLLEGGYRQT